MLQQPYLQYRRGGTRCPALAGLTRNASIAQHVQASNIATGMQVLNAVRAVCEAPPGFATNATLPLIRSATGFRS